LARRVPTVVQGGSHDADRCDHDLHMAFDASEYLGVGSAEDQRHELLDISWIERFAGH
jgi:hypothetical protein